MIVCNVLVTKKVSITSAPAPTSDLFMVTWPYMGENLSILAGSIAGIATWAERCPMGPKTYPLQVDLNIVQWAEIDPI